MQWPESAKKDFDKLWGGSKLKTQFNYNTTDSCGECWGISAHDNGSNIILNTIHKGKSLKYLFDNEKSLFGNYKGLKFPILVKLIDASKDLSVQVHPDDLYAKKYKSFGKSECWYILGTNENTDIIIGHKAKSKTELANLINQNDYESLLNKFKINKGDYFYIESGTIHAICANTLLLEVQQSADITFRLYDYNRLENGVPRDLHIEEAINVISIGNQDVVTKHNNKYFDYKIININNPTNFTANIHGDYIVILEGTGMINEYKLKKGDFLMISSNEKYSLSGNLLLQRTIF